MSRYSPYAIYLDVIDTTARIVPNPECEQASQHTACPDRYLNWHAWAEEMAETHTQARCPGCSLWNVWNPR